MKKIQNSKFKIQSYWKGYSLVQILVGVAMASIVVVIIFSVFDPFAPFQGGKDVKRKKDLSQIQRSLELYKEDFGKYPPSRDNKITGVEWGKGWNPYMIRIPQDPDYPQKTYIYWSDSTGQAYRLYASLDRKNRDPQVCKPSLPEGGPCAFVPDEAQESQCGSICNYGVSSQNTSF